MCAGVRLPLHYPAGSQPKVAVQPSESTSRLWPQEQQSGFSHTQRIHLTGDGAAVGWQQIPHL